MIIAIKKIIRAIRGLLIFFVFIYILQAMLLNIPYFQSKFSNQIASYLTKKLHTEVQIGRIEMNLFNRLILKDVYMEDRSGEVLFQAKRVAAGFDFLPVFKKKLRFSSVQLFSFQCNLSRETDDSPLNIQYIIDAFARQDTIKNDFPFELQIKKLDMQMGQFSYRVKNKPETPGIFNSKQLSATDIFSKIQIEKLNNKELELQINKLSFKEQSGLQIKNVTFNLNANDKEAAVAELKIELNKSVFLLKDISARYDMSATGENRKEPVAFRLKLEAPAVYPKELSPLLPALSNFDDRISLEGNFSGTEDNLSVKNFYFRYNSQIMINANAELQNLFQSNRNLFYVRGRVSNSHFSSKGIEGILNNLLQQPVELPKQIKQLEDMRFEGNINGSLNDLTASGAFYTNAGVIKTNLNIGKNGTGAIKGQIASEQLDLEKLLNNSDYGEMIFDIQLDAKPGRDKKLAGSIVAKLPKFVYKGYAYNNLELDGDFTPASFEGRLNLNSPDGKISGKGIWIFNGADSKFDFQADISNLQLDKLNLINKYKQSLLSVELNANLTGNNPDNFSGIVSLKNLQFKTEKGKYHLDSLQVVSTPSGNGKYIHIQSDLLTGEIKGNYSFKTIIPALKQTLANYLPSLITPNPKYSGDGETDFSLHLTIEDLTDFSGILELPFSLHGKSEIFGSYNGNGLSFKFETPQAVIGGSKIDSLRLEFTNPEKGAQVQISGISLQRKNTRINFAARMEAANDLINTAFHWNDNKLNYRGRLELKTLFSKSEERSPVRIETNILQTDLVFNDSIWTLYPATIVVDSSNININHLQAFHRDQFLKINGSISHNPEEELQIDLNDVDLEYIFQSLSIPALEFGGMATGFVKAQDIFKKKKLDTHLDITDFSFNKTNFGHLVLTGKWDDTVQGVLMSGKTILNDSSNVVVNGVIYPVKQELSIDFNAENADARFLRKYLNNVVQDLTGNLSGHLRLFGDLNNPTVEGDVFARNCRFGIGFLNTFYTFTDSVKCLPDTIKINNIAIYDEKGNKATATGFVKHRLFQDFYFAANIYYTNFMLFNATRSLNPIFYGTAYGSGTAYLYGTDNAINIEVKAQNTDNTKMTLNFMEESDVEDYNFIRFTSVKKPVEESSKEQTALSKPVTANEYTGPEIRFNLTLNPNSRAIIDMIMDPVSGDKISGYGNGNIQIQYGTKIPLKVLGNYVIEHGKFNFSLQQLFFRTFDIQDGSSVTFSGNPYTAELNVKANYTVNANLDDLDRQLIEDRRSARNNVPVSCILLLTGPMNQPKVAFDLDLPGATDELVRQVKSYIRTDDMMSRQIVYLLVLSRFYTPPENVRDNNTIANSNWSYLTSTLSTQLSKMLGSLSDNVQLGTIFHQSNTGYQTNTEFELLLSSQLLNNRLIINGNFGYSSNPFYNSNQKLPLIGDFDLEYKLTQKGDIRLKGFNHYNFRNYYSITPEMTQGIGILFRKDFNHLRNLFGKKKANP